MSTSFPRALPARPDLEQQQKLAKDLLRGYRAADAEAIARIRDALPDKKTIALADAQFTLAREYGFANWSALREHIEHAAAERLDPVARFKRAVHRRDADALRRVLSAEQAARDAIDQPFFDFDSPALRYVSNDRSTDVLDVLLEFGADPNRKSGWWAGGFHPLYGASEASAEHLLKAGATIDACAAAHLGRVDVLEQLISEDPARVHERGGDGQTPLHFASTRAVADFLLAHGADLDARDVDHRSTPAEWMVTDRTALASYLVDRGAHADIFLAAALGKTATARTLLEKNPALLSLRTGQGEYAEKKPGSYQIYVWTIGANLTPLQAAAKFGQSETLEVMSRFASPAQKLLVACNRGRRDEALTIVRQHPGIIEPLSADDRRALADEAWAANAPAVELMLELGFDPAVTSGIDGKGGNALHCAAWEGSAECVDAILRHPSGRAIINAREPAYNSLPIGWCGHGSVHCGRETADHATVARLLIAAGARIDEEMLEWDASEQVKAVLTEALNRGQGAD